MTMSQIVATVTCEPVTAAQVDAVFQRLGKALPVQKVNGGIVVGEADSDSAPLNVRVIADTLTLAVKELHGEMGLWAAAAIAASLSHSIVNSGGQALPANATTVGQLLGHSFTDKGKDVAERLGLILPRIRGGIKAIKF